MKRTLLILSAATLLFTACNNEAKSDTASKEDTAKSKTADASTTVSSESESYTAPDSTAMMKAWMEFMTPGEMHKVMASTDGTWECDVTHWMTAGAPPSTSKATATYKTIYNGLYQEGGFKGSFDGMAFEGKSVTAYDNAKKKFTSSWIDNMGSGIMVLEGDYDPATKTFTLAGTGTNPLTKKECNVREVVKMTDANTQIMEMYGPDPMTNKEYKSMEIVMKRKK